MLDRCVAVSAPCLPRPFRPSIHGPPCSPILSTHPLLLTSPTSTGPGGERADGHARGGQLPQVVSSYKPDGMIVGGACVRTCVRAGDRSFVVERLGS